MKIYCRIRFFTLVALLAALSGTVSAELPTKTLGISNLSCRITSAGGVLGRSVRGTFKSVGIKKELARLKSRRDEVANEARELRFALAQTTKSERGLRSVLKLAIAARRRTLTQIRSTIKGINSCKNASLSALPEMVPTELLVDTLVVSPGEQITVPADLSIVSSGDVIINGSLRAEKAQSQQIRISSQTLIEVGGSLEAGTGVSGKSIDGKGAKFRAEDGAPGGSIALNAPVITIRGSAQLTSGTGGTGRPISGSVPNSPEAASVRISKFQVQAGKGGKGGDIILNSGAGVLNFELSTNGAPLLVLGNGGAGGNARAFTGKLARGVKSLDPRGGGGGNSGRPILVGSTLTGLTYQTHILSAPMLLGDFAAMPAGATLLTLDPASASIFGGGVGGKGGDATVGKADVDTDSIFQASASQALAARRMSSYQEMAIDSTRVSAVATEDSCVQQEGKEGRSCTPAKGARGGDGFFCPGDGGSVSCVDDLRDATGTRRGGDAVVEAGDGGDLSVLLPFSTTVVSDRAEFGLGLNVSAGLSANGLCGRGGHAGVAIALAGSGGPKGGFGGEAKATGGTGGNAHYTPSGLDINLVPTTGGLGGRADAIGGAGRKGVSCCPAKAGQDGGTSGSALALGGNSGDGTLLLFPGGARARSGNAGAGGDGDGPGSGGQIGQAQARAGNYGRGLKTPPITPGPGQAAHAPVVQLEENGLQAANGNPCPQGPAPTPTSGTTGPGLCPVGRYQGNNGCDMMLLDVLALSGSGSLRSVGVRSGDDRFESVCRRTANCECAFEGITINNIPDHQCCAQCINGRVTVNCQNEFGGQCLETFQR